MRNLAKLERKLGVSFRDETLLRQALMHRSFLNENPGFSLPSNERLEFLGDSILGYLVAEHLYLTYPDLSEGDMTTLRAALVREETLALWAARLDLGDYLYLGRGEIASGGRTRQALLARACEALMAALALDQGLDAVRAFALRFIGPETERVIAEQSAKDYKSRLQEFVQSQRQITPTYRIVETAGPDHARTFTVEVLVGEQPVARGVGPSKQQAEQEAARGALETAATW